MLQNHTIATDAPARTDATEDAPLLCGGCLETLAPDSRCMNVGACDAADRAASVQSMRRGAAASARPAAWTLGGRVD